MLRFTTQHSYLSLSLNSEYRRIPQSTSNILTHFALQWVMGLESGNNIYIYIYIYGGVLQYSKVVLVPLISSLAPSMIM